MSSLIDTSIYLWSLQAVNITIPEPEKKFRTANRRPRGTRQKKADVVRRPKAFDHVGLLYNGRPGEPGNPLSSHPTETDLVFEKGFDTAKHRSWLRYVKLNLPKQRYS
jgi:hypothetical protein